MNFSWRQVVKVAVWGLSGDADRRVGWRPKSASGNREIRRGPAVLFPNCPHSPCTAPSCARLVPGITGLLLRNAALPWFPAGPWKEQGIQQGQELPSLTPAVCHKGPGAWQGPQLGLPPSLQGNKRGDLASPRRNSTVRAEEEAVSSPLSPLSQPLVPLSCAVQTLLPSGRALLHWDFRSNRCTPLAFHVFAALYSELLRHFYFVNS